jgi:hypothetical protein
VTTDVPRLACRRSSIPRAISRSPARSRGRDARLAPCGAQYVRLGQRNSDDLLDLAQCASVRQAGATSADHNAAVLAAEHEPGKALARWMQRFVDFIFAKRGLAAALHSGDPAYNALPAYFQERLLPAFQALFEAATAAGKVRGGVEPYNLLRAAASLRTPGRDVGPDHARRMAAPLSDGLRYSSIAP